MGEEGGALYKQLCPVVYTLCGCCFMCCFLRELRGGGGGVGGRLSDS